MEVFSVKNLSFRYNNAPDFALNNINLDVKSGDFLLLIGESGSGKTTLLKMLKRELTPFGEVSGEIFFKGNKIENLSRYDSASKIGFIMQDPDSQIVTDKVYSELAFGLENLGVKQEVIRAKVSEFSSYFGLQDKFNSPVNALSGGEKQLLNLASVMVMNPEVVILDEPLSMLDPISAINFINCLKRINDDIGTTIIIAEHHLSDIFHLANKAALLENGKLTACTSPRDLCAIVKDKKIAYTLPSGVRVFNKLGGEGEVPLTVKECRKFLKTKNNITVNNSYKEIKDDTMLSVKDIWFRYERGSRDILKGCNLTVNRGECYALLGANGCGKSTLINVIADNLKPYRGKKICRVKTALLPQNPRDSFVKDRLEDDFKAVDNSYLELCEKFGITHLLSRHPYDLSGGEIQRAAIVKILLSKPDMLLVDEPTKGLDSFAKKELGEFLRSLNITILLVTHDLDFAAQFADRCGLLFNGEITAQDYTDAFFLGNGFYTTSVVKMCRGIIDNAVKVDDFEYKN